MEVTIPAVAAFISNVGFPIAVAVYLVVEQRRQMGRLTQEVTKLRIAIIILSQKLGVNLVSKEGEDVNLMD